MRVATGVLGSQTDQLQQLADARASRRLRRGESMQHQGLAQHGAHRHARIERGVGILEDHLHVPALRAHPRLRQAEQILAIEAHASARWFEQAQHQPADRRLAATRFAHDCQRFARVDMEVDAVDGADMAGDEAEGAALHREVLLKLSDLEQSAAHVRTCDSGARRQRERWPGATSTRGGGAATH